MKQINEKIVAFLDPETIEPEELRTGPVGDSHELKPEKDLLWKILIKQ